MNIWETTLDQLEMQMTRATFDAWLKNTYLICPPHDDEPVNGKVIIGVKSNLAKDWLKNRLHSTIHRTLIKVLGRDDFELSFQVETQPEINASPAPTKISADLYNILQFDPYEAGYTPHAHFIQQFWGPYLGADALQLWSFVRSFYLEPRYIYDKTQKGYVLNPNWSAWTPPREFRAQKLAHAIKNYTSREGNRKKITGAWRSCPHFQNAFNSGKPLTAECSVCVHPQHQFNVMAAPSEEYPNGRPTCRYWQTGLLEHLQTEGVARVEITGDPRKPRTIFVKIQVYQLLPLLTPFQVKRLNEVAQIEYKNYLTSHQINLQVWQALTDRSLISLIFAEK